MDTRATGSPATWSAVRQAQAVRAKELSSRELLASYLDRIDQLGQPVNAVVTLDAERGFAAAARADEAIVRGENLGPLHGLPVTIKDAIEVRGMRSTGGATELTGHVPAANAPVIDRLEAAGAFVFGKTNVPRWSGDIQTFNELFGTTNNPWDLGRTPGGSSGGPAAAVVCGFTSFEIGTDIGGSVRTPAHFCGAFGLKPSYGVISQRGYLDHVGGGTTDADINVFGPITRSADDLALLLGVLGGPDDDRALAWRLDLPAPRHADLHAPRIGVWLDDPDCPTDRGQLAVLRAAVDRLADAGAQVEEAHPPVSLTEQRDLFFQLISAAVAPSQPAEVGEVMGGTHLAWLAADARRAAARRTWATWFEHFDALLCPVMPTAAFPHDRDGGFGERTLVIDGRPRPHVELVTWTGIIGVVGLPSAVPPVGRTAGGLPVGLQVVAPFLRDHEAVWLAGRLAEVSGGGYVPPPGF
jgi:amidase